MMACLNRSVLASIVTWNDAPFLETCLGSLMKQTVPLRILVHDNGSSDRSVSIARAFGIEVHEAGRNLGYSAGHNANLLRGAFDYAVLVNADVRLQPDYIERLINDLEVRHNIGMAGGKVYRMSLEGERVLEDGNPVMDSTGIYFTPTLRHFDRGSQEADVGQYGKSQLVFGITGALLFCRREMLEDVRLGNEYLDNDFFAYREDADLAWRAQLAGWGALYEPGAVADHVRHVVPSRRSSLDPRINYHSLKNRYLMRTKNIDSVVWRKCCPFFLVRDLGILGYVLLRERSSLAAYRDYWRFRHRALAKRRQIQLKRKTGAREIARWFSFRPVAYDIRPRD